jgi:phosphoribosylformimino-5-aminoimidazole carboxamide ribotide isomerase
VIAIPAVDLRDGACVQLVGGSYADERVREPDALAAARRWAECGFAVLHVVDLDAATGRGDNSAVVAGILRDAPGDVYVGGGVRTTDRISELLDAGAARVIVGTRAVEDPEWLSSVAARFPDRLIVAADARDRAVVTRGWTRAGTRDVVALAEELSQLPLAALLVTAVHREGQMRGPDLRLIDEVVSASRVPVIASGGVGSRSDLDSLAELGVAATIIGMALYTGTLDPHLIAEEYAE